MALSNLHIDRDRLAEVCRRYGVACLEVIGSFARGDEGPGSASTMKVFPARLSTGRRSSVSLRR